VTSFVLNHVRFKQKFTVTGIKSIRWPKSRSLNIKKSLFFSGVSAKSPQVKPQWFLLSRALYLLCDGLLCTKSEFAEDCFVV